ncbi:MAG: YesL family protein [Firmicutes bacterium]|nr:YesL family protein [Bacillota bacterium]
MGRIFNLDSPVFRSLSRIADLIYLNILTLLCCIPIVTAGASMTALNYVVLKMVRNEEGYLTRSFFKSFKENFRQSTIIWVIILAVFALIAGDFFILKYAVMEFPSWIKTALMAIAIILLFGLMHVFPVLARFDNTIINTFKNSFLMGILSFPKTVLMMIFWVIPIVIALSVYQILPLVLMLGISGPAYMCALLYSKTFQRFEPEEEIINDSEWTVGSEEGKE